MYSIGQLLAWQKELPKQIYTCAVKVAPKLKSESPSWSQHHLSINA